MTMPLPVSRRSLLAAAVVLCSGLALPACSAKWAAEPTRMEFPNTDDRAFDDIQRALRGVGFASRPAPDEDRVLFVTGIDTTRNLRAALRAIQDVPGVQPLQNATLVWGDLNLAVTGRTLIAVEFSRGSTLWIADGPASRPWRQIDVRREATSWEGPVNLTGVVAQTRGVVFVAIERNGAVRYERWDVFGGDRRAVSDVPNEIGPPPVAGASQPRRSAPAQPARPASDRSGSAGGDRDALINKWNGGR
jgi:hypothetical protein